MLPSLCGPCPEVGVDLLHAQDPVEVAGRPAALQERVADDHVFFWKAIVAEPCYWDSKVSGVCCSGVTALLSRAAQSVISQRPSAAGTPTSAPCACPVHSPAKAVPFSVAKCLVLRLRPGSHAV